MLCTSVSFSACKIGEWIVSELADDLVERRAQIRQEREDRIYAIPTEVDYDYAVFDNCFLHVVIDGKRYIDGAYTNSIPADLVKDMGADYIVGIDLSTRDTKPSLISKFFPTYKSKIDEPWEKGYKFSDLVIHPDLNGFMAYEFWKANEMYDIGYHQALQYIPQIKSDIERLSFSKK